MPRLAVRSLLPALALAALLGAVVSLVRAENIDPNDDNSQFVWGENVGWINAEPEGGQGVTVSGSKLTGYMWGENIGWINLHCENNAHCATVDYGVANDGAGNLSGYAWGENVGWISFSCTNTDSCGVSDYGVTIDPVTGIFSGFAYGENIGWISFSDDSPVAYQVQTDDGDLVGGGEDNCPFDANDTQDNNDRNFIELKVAHGKVYDDFTLANSDGRGDTCDDDDDNDGLTDEQEAGLGPGGPHHGLCPDATANTNPLVADTDGDLSLDWAECRLGHDPADAEDTPIPFPPNDSDFDGLPDDIELELGSDPGFPDTDGDKLLDGLEFRAYNTDPTVANTDGDTCDDAQEVASINEDEDVNSIDLQQVAISFGVGTNPTYIPNMDVNKDYDINSIDLLLVASRFNLC